MREGRASSPRPTTSPCMSCIHVMQAKPCDSVSAFQSPSLPPSSHCRPTQVCLFQTFTTALHFPHTCCACGPGAPAPHAGPTYLHGCRCTAGGVHCLTPLHLHSGCICSPPRCTAGGACYPLPLHAGCSCRPPHCRYVPHLAWPCHRPPQAAGMAVETTPGAAASAPKLPRLLLYTVVPLCLLLPVLPPVLLTVVLLCLLLLVSTLQTVSSWLLLPVSNQAALIASP